jgi:dihydrofolate synthase/folylpolyglutamate synthase
LNLCGHHQIRNAAIAILAIENLPAVKIKPVHIYRGLTTVRWRGRMEILSQRPLVVADVAHNVHAFVELGKNLHIYRHRRLIGIIGIMADKEFKKICSIIAPQIDLLVAVQPKTDRALESRVLAFEASRYTETLYFNSPLEGFRFAQEKADPNDMILISGSHFTVGEILSKFYT